MFIVALETRGVAPNTGSQREHQVWVKNKKQDKAIALG